MNPIKVASNFLKEAKFNKSYDFSSVQIELPEDIATEIRRWGQIHIPETILVKDGFEDDIHITLKYGIHITDFTKLRNVFIGVSPIEIELGKITIFDTDDADVVKIDVKSPEMLRLNKIISNSFEVTDSYPTYRPHTTVAYVKKGCGKLFDGCPDFEGRKLSLDTVVFSGKDNRYTTFKLPRKSK
jgi:2'-5' RNA ligase